MRQHPRASVRAALFAALVWLPAAQVSSSTLEWVTVGAPGNACNPLPWGPCLGGVAEMYEIGRTEITNAAYAEFLNAVAASDPNGLYDPEMQDDAASGGIVRSGVPGSFTYTVKPGFERKPVISVSLWDAMRFANWLHNGEPHGTQGPSTTEDGAYTLTPAAMASRSVTRNAGARVFLPSGDQWYKAGCFDGSTSHYFSYPTRSDELPTCTAPTDAPNSVNCAYAGGGVTEVGSYGGTPGPWGTFDQGGNVREWTDDVDAASGEGRRWGGTVEWDVYDVRCSYVGAAAEYEAPDTGFRVARLVHAVPAAGWMARAALLGVSMLVGIAARRRAPASRR